VKRRTAFLVSLGCAIALVVPAFAAAAIPPAALVAHSDELPGFAAAKVKLRWASSVRRYAKFVLGENRREARKEVARLKRKGFLQGVQELLSSPAGEALSNAVVFRSARGAERELKTSLAEVLKAQGKAVIRRFTVAAIPGSLGFSGYEAGQPGGAANVLFSTGRCFFLVGDALPGSTVQQLSVAPIAGATALYQRVASLCV
jgi:uncharacterized membrane protein YtjA (UPF0391 family)